MQRQLRRLIAGTALAIVGAACFNPEVAKQKYLESGNRYLEQKKYADAIVQYRNAINLDGKFAAAHRKLAEAYDASGDAGNAYREYARTADLVPDDVDSMIKAGSL